MNLFSLVRKNALTKKLLAWGVAFSLLLQSSAVFPLVAYADVTVRVTNSVDGTVTSTTLPSADDVSIFYTLPGTSSSTPTLDSLQDILGLMNGALVDAKTSTPDCAGDGSQVVSATTTGTTVVDGVSVGATATARATVPCVPSDDEEDTTEDDATTSSLSTLSMVMSQISENNAPVITVLADNPMTVIKGTPFTDPGATATDTEDGDITPQIVVAQEVNTLVVGTYTVSYAVSDSQGRAAVSKTRTVNVIDMYLPPMPACTGAYAKVISSVYGWGFNADDVPEHYTVYDGQNQPTHGDTLDNAWVHAEGVGTSITWDIGAGKLAQSVRVFPATDHSDRNEFNEYNVVVSADNVTWSLPLTATATYVGDINNIKVHDGVKDFVSTSSFRYIRLIQNGIAGNDFEIDAVKPCGVVNTKPVITVTNPNPMTVIQGSTFIDPSATVADLEDGNITDKLVSTGTVNTSILGTYTITYNATDSQNLAADTKTRTVEVIKDNKDCLAGLTGTGNSQKVPVYSSGEKTVQSILNDAGYTLDVVNDQVPFERFALTHANSSATIEVKLLGKYASHVQLFGYYTGTTSTGMLPVFRVGAHRATSTIELAQGGTTTFTISGTSSFAVAMDTQSGNDSAIFSTETALNPDQMTKHALVYHPSVDEFIVAFEDLWFGGDKDYNDLVVLMRVKDCDTPPPHVNEKPVITVTNPNPMTVIQGSVFTDPSATVADLEDGDITNKLVSTGTVNTSILGTYTITYNATDSQNLAADTKTRMVTVIPAKACAAPIDVMLVIDRSGSMNDDQENPEQPLTQAKDAANAFINTLATSSDLVGVVTYSTTATLNSALSSNFTGVKASYAGLTSSGSTNIGDAIARAQQEITLHGRADKKHVIILLSDGLPNVPTPDAVAYAKAKALAAKNAGTIIYTIGLGSEADPVLMGELASLPEYYFGAPTGAQLEGIYKAVAQIECDRLPSSVSGRKINDLNGNGLVEQGENGLAGWVITLKAVSGPLMLTATTTAGGTYSFPDVMAGNYMLCEVAQTGWTQTAPTINNGCHLLNIAPDAKIVDKNFLNTETKKPECRDGKDNDGDGKIDYPADPGCTTTDDNDENQKPVITVTPPNPAIVTLGTTYTDAGATVADPEDGNITNKLVTTGSVDVNTLGTYTITYNATDSKNIAADQKTRTVKVVTACADGKDNDGDGKIDFPADTGCTITDDNDENNKPVITVLGANPFDVTIGDSFTDPGANATDTEDCIGKTQAQCNTLLVLTATGVVNTSVLGTYTITYTAKDSKGLAADPKTRIVKVNPVITECNDGKDNDGDGKIDFPADTGCTTTDDNDENNKPVITVLGVNPFVVNLGTAFTDPGANATDTEDCIGKTQAQCNTLLTLTATGTVDINTLGTYTITYNAKDSKNLAADTKTRTVTVVSSCSDGKDNDGDNTIDYPADTGCDTPEDNSENSKPVITLLGDVVMNLVVGSAFTDPGATAADAEDGDITAKVVRAGSVNTAVAGTYTITYNATDSQNLSADMKTRTINMTPTPCVGACGGGSTPPACSDGSDNDGDGFADYPKDPGCDSSIDNDERDTGPSITLLGDNPMTITQGTTFTDPGATARDPEDGDITSRIVVSGSVNTSTVGAYILTYNVADAQGHAATPVTRTVNVVSSGCTSNCGGGGGGGPITLSIFNEKLTVTGTTTVVVTWNTNLPTDSRVVYGLDSHATLGNAPTYGYSLTTATDTTLTTNHSMTILGIPSAIATYYRPVSSDGARTVVGIELARIPTVGIPQECYYLRDYLRLGISNDPLEVIKLQSFLSSNEGFTTLAVTGFFDITTDAAVRAFQVKYWDDVLAPWDLPGSTGYVYYTTQKKINELYCKRTFALTPAQLAEIEDFRALIERIRTQNLNDQVLPIVGTNTTGGEVGGSVAGASIETEGAIASGAHTETNSNEATTSQYGRFALTDLLATAPEVVGELGTDTQPTAEAAYTTPGSDETVVAGASTERGFGAMMNALSDKLNISVNTINFIIFLIILSLIFGVIFVRTRDNA